MSAKTAQDLQRPIIHGTLLCGNISTGRADEAGATTGQSTTLAARFWSKVERKSPSECWPWLGKLDPYTYGRFSIGGRNRGAHRIAFVLTKGGIPLGLLVRHTCDNPRCCNPDHLVVGTHKDNVQDAISRGRRSASTDARVRWSIYPSTMRAAHLAEIYGYTLLTIRKMAQQRNPKIPTPSVTRPFGWNRDDVRRHYERRAA